MYEVIVTGHKWYNHPRLFKGNFNGSGLTKEFMKVTGFNSEESRHMMVSMISEGIPFVLRSKTYIKAMQVKIEFTHSGFTAEVVKVDG